MLLILSLLLLSIPKTNTNWDINFSEKLLAFAVLVVVFTEFCSAINQLTHTSASIFWGFIFSGSTIYVLKNKCYLSLLRIKLVSLTILSLGVVTLITLTLLFSIAYPPNNYDSMTYHLTRVLFWMQHQNVNHYITPNLRQIQMPPLAEFFTLNLYLLSDGDRLTNLVQWIFLLGNLSAVSSIIGHLGGKQKEKVTGTVLAVTIPMALLQSTTTQNDLAVSFFITSSYLFFFRFRKNRLNADLVFFSLSVALALLTKGTAYLFLAPLGVYFLALEYKNYKVLAISGLLILLLNVPHFNRNTNMFGNPLGVSDESEKVLIDHVSIKIVAENILRGTALHLSPPVPNGNTLVHKALDRLFTIIGLEIERTDNTFSIFALPASTESHEDLTPSFVHFCLIILLVLFFRQHIPPSGKPIFWINIISFFIVLVSIRYQIWLSRLHLPFFMVSAAFLGFFLYRSNKAFFYATTSILFISSIWFLFSNPMKPLALLNKTNEQVYFLNQPELHEKYKSLSIANDTVLYISTSGNGYDYPFIKKLMHNNNYVIYGEVQNSSGISDVPKNKHHLVSIK